VVKFILQFASAKNKKGGPKLMPKGIPSRERWPDAPQALKLVRHPKSSLNDVSCFSTDGDFHLKNGGGGAIRQKAQNCRKYQE
jgi:hypothetical protein